MTRRSLIGGGILAVIVLGGIVFWQMPNTIDSESSTMADVDKEPWLPPSNNSDEAAAIQAELEATSMTEFENEMRADADASASSM